LMAACKSAIVASSTRNGSVCDGVLIALLSPLLRT
jgi:hypothetical protein